MAVFRKRVINRLVFATFFIACWPVLALAESESVPDDLSFMFEEEDLFISATQSARTLDKAPAIATVITAKELKDMGARNLLDALKTVPGFGVSYASNFTVEQSLEVRGMKTDESEKVLLLVDGLRVNAPVSGSWTIAFDDFPVDSIKRIEIIRGPGSALYGANAFVAVINIIMKKPGEMEGASLTAGAGSDKTLRQNIQIGHKAEKFSVIGVYDHWDTDGTREFVAQDSIGQSGYTNFWSNNHTGYVAANYDRLSFNGVLINKRRGTPLTITNQIDILSDAAFRQLVGELSYHDRLGLAEVELSLGVDHSVADPVWWVNRGGVMTANPQLKNLTLSPQLKASFDPWNGHFLTVGIEYDRMRQFDVVHIVNGADVSATFNHNQNVTRQVWAAYAQDEWEISQGATFTAGVRLDHYSDFGATVNPRAAFVWTPLKSVDLKLLYGRAFRAPSFVELYEINNPAAVGNSDLKPEIMNTVEASINWRMSPRYHVNADVFYNRFTDRIVRQPPPVGNINTGGAKIWGVEAEFRADIRDALYGYVNYAYQLTKDDSTGTSLPDVPKHRIKAGVNAGFFDDKIITHVDVRWTGERQRVQGDPRPATSSNTVVDLALHTQRLLDGIDLAAKLHNLFDSDIYDPSPNAPPFAFVSPGFPRPGRTWLVEATYNF